MKLKNILSRITLSAFVISTLMVFFLNTALAKTPAPQKPGRDKQEILVKYKDDTKSDSTRNKIKNKLNLKSLKPKMKFKKHKMELMQLGESDNIDNVIKELKKDPNVEYAQPNYLLTISALPNDPYFAKQWGLANNGQTVESIAARSGVDINAQQAWDITEGSPAVTVGVLDTGIDITHEDLINNIYINSNEIAGNGIDDDNNGYIDDVNGWNFADGSSQIYDSENPEACTHGTEVAGIIAASANNSKGISGAAPNVKILPLKFINGNVGYTSDAIDAIEYAMSMNVKVINCSFAGSDNNAALKDAMQNSGILFVCSAGNTGADVSVSPVYPACFGLPNIISAAAIDGNGVLANFSSFGSSIEVAAPGVNIFTTTSGNSYDYMSGTSASTGFVTGTAALILSQNPALSITDVKARMVNNVVKCTNLNGKVSSEGRIDAKAALTNIPPTTTDTYAGEGWPDVTVGGDTAGGDADSWYTTDQLAKVKQQIHYGESGINPATGNFSMMVNDMSVTSPGFTIDISRTYNSKDDKSNTMGRGWTFGFEGSAVGINSTSDMVVAALPNGAVERFVRNPDGSYTASDSRSRFVRNADGTCTLTTKDQYSYGFNTNGYLTWMADRNGNTVNITVDSSGKVTHVTDQAGRTYTVSYNENGLISQITDPESRVVKYSYLKYVNLSFYLLTQVTDPMGKKMYYNYDPQGYLSNIADNDNNIIQRLVHDHTTNNVSQATDANGDISIYTYDLTNRKTTISENDGARQWIYWYDSSYYITKTQDPEGRTAATVYVTDSSGRNKYGEVQSETDRCGNTTAYERDGNGNITKITNPDSSAKNYKYDNKNDLIMEEDEGNKFTFYIYDADQKNLLLKIQPVNENMQYNLVTGNDANGIYSFSIYDDDNNLLLQAEPANGNTVYAQGSDLTQFAITTYTYYSDAEAQQLGYTAKGLLKTLSDPENNITTYAYNANGDNTTITGPEGNVTTNSYNNIGWKTSTTSPNQFNTTYTYDQNGLLEKTALNNGETLRTVYDAMGRKTQEISPNQYVAANDSITTHTYSDNTVGTRYTYYISGKVASETDALNNQTAYTYDVYGNMLTETKPNGSIYTYTYDCMDRLKTVSFQYNSVAAPVLLEQYSYAVLDNGNTQKTETKFLNVNDKAITVYTYDYAGRLVSRQNPDGTTTKTGYNANGTISTTTDANGSIAFYQYDGLNRLTIMCTPLGVFNGSIFYGYTVIEYDRSGNKTTVASLYNGDANFVVTNYTYYKNGKLKSVTDSAGRRTDYVYDGDGNVLEQDVYTNPTNKNITEYTYNQIGKPLTKKVHVSTGDISGNDINDPQDMILTTTYNYDNNGNLKTVTTPDQIATTYTYDALDRQTSISQPGVDENGNAAAITTSTTYNWEGKPLTTVDANGKTTMYTYNQRGLLQTTTDAKGGVTAYYYDTAGRKIAEVSPQNYDSAKTVDQMNRTEYTYDLMDRVKEKIAKYIDPAASQWITLTTKAYTYDKNGNVAKEQDALGIEGNYGTQYTYNLVNKLLTMTDPVSEDRGLPYTIKNEYDGIGRKISETNAKDVVTSYSYDDAGNITAAAVNGQTIKTVTYDLTGNALTQTDGNGSTTTFEYNALGKLRKAIYPGDATIPENTVTYQYDVMGRLANSQDSTGKVDTCTYDNQGRQTSQTEKNIDGSQEIITYVKYDKNGNKRFVTDGNGVTTENTYDELNRIVSDKITVSGVCHTTSYTYDANGNRLTVTDWRGNTIRNIYDPLNRLIEKDDAYGKVIQKLEYNKNSAQSKSYDALGNTTQYIYDKNNRLISTIDPEGHTTSQSYDNAGNINKKTDGRGITTTYNYDQFNRLVSVADPKTQITSYTYDLNGNMLTQTDGKGNTTTFEYNAANKAVRKIDHGGRTGSAGSYTYNPAKTESYTYYADGSLASKTDRNGNTTIYTYDIHGRMLSQAIGSNEKTYTYDNNGNQLTMADSTATTTRIYDELGRALSKTVSNLGQSTYAYDITTGVPEGRTAEISTDPKGHTTTKVYDKAGRLTTVTVDGKATNYIYYDNGSLQSVIYPDASREDYTYYKDNLNKTLTNKKADGTVIDTYSYTYDSAHNQTSKTDAKGTTTYTYDSLNRLETVTEPTDTVTSYTYDKAGNRQTQVVTSGGNATVTIYTYNEQNRLLNTTTINAGAKEKVVYSYDNNGNTVSSTRTVVKPAAAGTTASVGISLEGQSASKEVTLNQYDVWNQLVKTTVGDKTITNTYNGDGLRDSKTVNGLTTRYFYEYDKVVLELNGDGSERARNVQGTNLISRTADGQTGYYFYNGHGDVTSLQDENGQQLASYYYDAFGNIESVIDSVYNPYRYAGYYYDEETDTYYLLARFYDPTTARFLSEDTYRGNPNDPLSLNLYTYAFNNPVSYIDLDGHAGTPVAVRDSAPKGSTVTYTPGKTPGTSTITITDSKGNKTTLKQGPDYYITKEGRAYYWNSSPSSSSSNQKSSSNLTSKQTTASTSNNTIYTVKKNDCLSVIAKKYNTTVPALAKANNITDSKYTIRTGQSLIIPIAIGSISFTYTSKIEKQMGKRGWTNSDIQDALDNYVKKVKTYDTRFKPDGSGMKNNEPATAYYSKDGGYVVRNDSTGDIVQVSDRNDPEWKDPFDKDDDNNNPPTTGATGGDISARSGNAPAKTSTSNTSSTTSNVKKATGWAIAGAVTYWIVSEGSRIVFPPRNFVPVL